MKKIALAVVSSVIIIWNELKGKRKNTKNEKEKNNGSKCRNNV